MDKEKQELYDALASDVELMEYRQLQMLARLLKHISVHPEKHGCCILVMREHYML